MIDIAKAIWEVESTFLEQQLDVPPLFIFVSMDFYSELMSQRGRVSQEVYDLQYTGKIRGHTVYRVHDLQVPFKITS